MTDAEKLRRAVEEDIYMGDDRSAPLLAAEVRRLRACVLSHHAPAIGTFSACTDCGRCGRDVGGPCACDGSAGEGGAYGEAEG